MRNYKRKTDFKHISPALFEQARRLIEGGLSIRGAAAEIGVADSSLRARLKKGVGSEKHGRFRSIFTQEQEEDVVRHCIELDKRLFGLTLKSLRFLLYNYATENGITHRFSSTSKLAGRDFTRSFMKRNKLSLRVPRKTSVARMMGFNRTQLNTYFENLEAAMAKYGFTPDRIYNMDETGVQTVPSKLPKHVAPTGKREVGKSVAAEQGQTVSAACAVSATGHYVPPFFIFARKRKNPLLIKDGPSGCQLEVTDKGYMNIPTFLKWLDHFKKFTNPSSQRPILLILDNHVSHVSLEAVTFAKDNNIHMLTLPPHSSHKTQPLDRNFFRPLKAFYDAAGDDWSVCHPGQTLSIYDVAGIFKTAFLKAATRENAENGFRATGIFPLDRNKFTDADFLPSEVTDQSPDEEEEIDLEDRQMIVFDVSAENSELHVENSNEQRQLGNESRGGDDSGSSDVASVPANAVPGPPKATCCTAPETIIPLPRIQIRRKRSGRGLKSVLLTSTPNRERLIAERKTTSSKKIKGVTKEKATKMSKVKKTLFVKRLQTSPDSPKSSEPDSDDYSVHNSSSDLNMSFSAEEEDQTLTDGADVGQQTTSNNDGSLQLQKDDFAVIKVQGKTKFSFRLYVVKVVAVYDDGFEGVFFKRVPNSHRFSPTPEEAFFDIGDVKMKLTQPVIHNNTRFQNTLSFQEDLAGVH